MSADDRPDRDSFGGADGSANGHGGGHERFGEWDAAYVMGALSLTDRREFEEHLASCAECARSLAALAALPGLLSALPADEALALLTDDGVQPRDATTAGQARTPSSLMGPVAQGSSVAQGSAVVQSSPVVGAAVPGAGAEFTRGSRPAPDPTRTPDFLPALAVRVRRHRRRRLTATIGAGLAAAALIVGVIVVQPLAGHESPTATAKLSQVVPSALGADVEFTSETWGTKIDMTCWYGGPAAGSGSSSAQTWRYGLYVTDRSGHTTRVSTWTADPGSRAATSGSIDTALSDLSRVEVRNESSGTVLLAKAIARP